MIDLTANFGQPENYKINCFKVNHKQTECTQLTMTSSYPLKPA